MSAPAARALAIPELCLVVLVGTSGSGKSTFAARHFRPTEVVSSDVCRGLVSDDENDQTATPDAFDLLHHLAGIRLAAGRLTVIDATNVQVEARRPLIELARRHHVLAVAVVLDVPERDCAARNATRPDRQFGPHVLHNQAAQLRRSLRGLRREGFHRVHVLDPATIDTASFARQPLWNDRRDDHGPFDLIGDVHGCADELVDLLATLGYVVADDGSGAHHPEGRRALFLGDLVDRGPATPTVLRLAIGMVAAGDALCLPGNHEVKLLRALQGKNVTVSHGLAESLAQLEAEPAEFRAEVATFIDGLIGHLVLDDGQLVVAHAGLPQAMHGRASAAVRSFALYGDTTGETDEYGLPVRYPWAADYRGDAAVVYGHTPVPEAVWENGTLCIDTGCVFGGRLTALRYPERELVSVPARRVYYEPVRPVEPPAVAPEQDRGAGELDLQDVLGRRVIATALSRSITVREEHAAAALEVMSRFAVDPRWLVYLPPTMPPVATSSRPGLLEHPEDAFAAYREAGVGRVVCEEKHMGSRAVVVVGREPEAVARRFAIAAPDGGRILTRTGRPFAQTLLPTGEALEAALLTRLRAGLDRAGLWDELRTDWLVLDCEILPWSLKAEDLLRQQYAAVGTAATATLAAERDALRAAAGRGIGLDGLDGRTDDRAAGAAGFVDAYRRYCWPVDGVEGIAVAPFHILAGEAAVHARRDHHWQLELLGRLCRTDPALFRLTRSITVDVDNPAEVQAGIDWWEELTGAGGEGMVVKPLDVIHVGPRGPAPHGIKVRGREYLRIIYGPDYTAEANLARLRSRGLGHKRSLAQREFALGLEALDRFVAGEPLYRVHECVFGILALESEPIDPRL